MTGSGNNQKHIVSQFNKTAQKDDTFGGQLSFFYLSETFFNVLIGIPINLLTYLGTYTTFKAFLSLFETLLPCNPLSSNFKLHPNSQSQIPNSNPKFQSPNSNQQFNLSTNQLT